MRVLIAEDDAAMRTGLTEILEGEGYDVLAAPDGARALQRWTDERVDFIGGARGTKTLEQIVDSGKAAVAFSMYPVSVDDLLAISDAGGIMPPKSTWFEPKLRDGLLIHLI